MSYALRNGEKFAHGIRRIIRKQIDGVIENLKTPRDSDAIHQAREGLKKARAALRLVRARLGRKLYRREDGRLRAVGCALSGARDADVVLGTIDKLRQSSPGRSGSVALAELRKFGVTQRAKCLRHSKQAVAKTNLRAARRGLKRLPLGHLKWSDLRRGLRRTYERSLAALQEAERTRAAEDLHEWRKRVKDLRYQLQILSPASPETIPPLVAKAKLLGEQLGDEHDLVMLEAAARQAGLGRRELNSVSKLVQARRKKLQMEAFRHGREFYCLKSPAFARRNKHFGKILDWPIGEQRGFQRRQVHHDLAPAF